MGNKASSINNDLDGSGLSPRQLDKKLITSAKKADAEVGKKLKKEVNRDQGTVKLLLLGAGESGKTTVLKQMTLLHGSGFDERYKNEIRPDIFHNIVDGACTLITLCQNEGYNLEEANKQEAADKIIKFHESKEGLFEELDEEIVDSMLLLAKGEDFVKEFMGKPSQIQDSWWAYMKRLENFPAWGGGDWKPTNEDILLTRVRTTGINCQNFNIDGVNFQMTDVGGQRSERKKWMKLFSGVTGVMFVASLADYDKNLFEDETTNCLDESLTLWKQHSNKSEFSEAALILFLNKYDLFQEKYYSRKVPIEFSGDLVHRPAPTVDEEKDENCEVALQWFTELFQNQVDVARRNDVYMHITTALDQENMKKVMNSCASHVLRQNMKLSGMMI